MPKAVKITKKTLALIEAETDIHQEELKAFHMNSYLVIGRGITYPWLILSKRHFKKNFAFFDPQSKDQFTEVVTR